MWNLSSNEGSAGKCAACTAAVFKVSSEVLKQSTYDYLVPLATEICMLVASDAATVCPGIIPMMGTAVLDMIGRELLSKERVCNEFLEVCSIPSFETITVEDFSNRVLADKPELIQNDDYVTNLYSQIYNDPNPRVTLRAVHISDPHIDLMYKVGSLSNCPGFLCCREEWGYPTNPAYQAGQFGSGSCDLPVSTLENML